MRTALKKFRIGLHLTQEQMAKEIGVSRATYSFVERGERSGSQAFWDGIQKEYKVPDSEMYSLTKLDEQERSNEE